VLLLRLGIDIVAIMDGDGQMDPKDLPALLDAIVDGFDYVKGNRFLHSSIKSMPPLRYIGNRILSTLMRYALGALAPLDAQCGYSAISGAALRKIDLEILYPRYGFLNALLFSLLESNSKVASVPVRTVYGEEISGINPFVTVPTIFYIICKVTCAASIKEKRFLPQKAQGVQRRRSLCDFKTAYSHQLFSAVGGGFCRLLCCGVCKIDLTGIRDRDPIARF